MSAIPVTSASLNSGPQAVVFQLLNPIGGVLARPFSNARAGAGPATTLTPVAASSIAASAPAILRGVRTAPP
jgi:hypothetical protein